MRTTTAPHRLITGLLVAVLSLLLPTAPALAAAASPVTTQESSDAAPSLVLLMDSSGSMRDPDSTGQPKIEAARTALDSMITGLDPAEQVGFRVFGATVQGGENNPKACTDSQLVVPIGTDNRPQLSAAVKDYQPKGDTPIGYALQQAAGDLGDEGNRTITLVSDGLATCDPDPCPVAQDLADQGIDLTIHVVGFDVDTDARDQLQCIASAGRGTYYDADDTQSLTAALDRLATRAFKPFTIEGTPVVGHIDVNKAPELEPGRQYTDILAGEGVIKHYLIERTMPGSAIHVGVSGRSARGATGGLQIDVETLDTDSCGSGFANTSTHDEHAGDIYRLLSAQVTVFPDGYDDDTCMEEDVLVLSVEMTDWETEIGGTPYEIVVAEEPAISNAESLPEDTTNDIWQAMEPAEPEELTAGTSFNDAPLIEPGKTYSGEILTGETMFVRVPVDFGQALQAQVDLPTPGPALTEAVGGPGLPPLVMLKQYSPHRGEVTENYIENAESNVRYLDARGRIRAQAATPEVRWRNREGINASEFANTAGDYYVALALSGDEQDESYLVPFTLTVDAIGEAGQGAPTYLQAPSTAEPDTSDGGGTESIEQDDGAGQPVEATEDAAAEGDAAPADPDDVVPGAASAAGSDDVPTAVLISLGVVGLVVLTVGALGVFRVLNR